MKTILLTILSAIGSSLAKVLVSLFSAVKETFTYFLFVKKTEKEEKDRKECQEYNKKVKNICDNGTVEDLLNL